MQKINTKPYLAKSAIPRGFKDTGISKKRLDDRHTIKQRKCYTASAYNYVQTCFPKPSTSSPVPIISRSYKFPIPINSCQLSHTKYKDCMSSRSPLLIFLMLLISRADISLHSSCQIPVLEDTENIRHGNFQNLVTDNAQKNARFYEYVSMNFNKMTFNTTDTS